MEENSKLFIKAMMYYGIALDEPATNTIRGFAYQKNKEETDSLIRLYPEDHPSRKLYDTIEFENFEQTRAESITKMAMWVIEKGIENWDIHDEEKIEETAEEIYQMNIDNIVEFINGKEELLSDEENKFAFDFAILYKYLLRSEPKNLNYIKKEAELIEKSNLTKSVIIDEDVVLEKYSYLSPLYSDLATYGQYSEAKEFFNKYRGLLEEFLKENPDSYQAKNDFASVCASGAYAIWDTGEGLNEEADELLLKSISIREDLIKEYPNAKKRLYILIAVSYQNMAHEYKKAYKKENTEELKDKYFELYSKAVFYREELDGLDQFDSVDEKIDNITQLAKIYYFLFNDEKAREYLNKAVEIKDNTEGVSQETIERINKLSEKLQSNE